jgi:hypothetical protein
MSRNALNVVIVVLALGLIWVSYLYYQKTQSGIAIRIDDHGMTIDGN